MRGVLLCAVIFTAILGYGQVLSDDIVFDRTEFDFGNIYLEDGIVTAKYTLTNNSSKEFVISNIDAACGCTNPRASLNKVPPGGKSVISAEFNPKGMVGTVNKWIYIQGNFQDGFQKKLTFTANIRSSQLQNRGDYYPGEFGYLRFQRLTTLFGEISDQRIHKDSILLSNDGYNDISVLSALKAPSYITIANLPLTLKPGTSEFLKIELDAKVIDTVGLVSGEIGLKTNDKFYAKKSVKYAADFVQDFSKLTKKELKRAPQLYVSNQVLDMGNMKSGEVKTKTITIGNKGKQPLKIQRVETDCMCAILNNLPPEINPGEQFTISASFDSLYKKGLQRKGITLFTNDPKNPRFIVTVRSVVN